MTAQYLRKCAVAASRYFVFIVLVVAVIGYPLGASGLVKSDQKISDTEGGFTGFLDDNERFGTRQAALGDLDGDGVTDLAVGAYHDGYGDSGPGPGPGAVWILFLDTDGTVKSHQKITDGEGGFTGSLDLWDEFGVAVACLGDLDGDDVNDLAVGARLDDDGGINKGAVWILFLNTDGTVKSQQKISGTEGGFAGDLDNDDWFGTSVAWLGDLDGNGLGELAVGATYDDDGGEDRGAVWVLSLNSDGTVQAHWKISDTQGGFTGVLDDGNCFGEGAALLGDLDGDGVEDLAVAAMRDDDGGTDRGAVWVLFLKSDNSVKGHQKISDTEGLFTGSLDDDDNFGTDIDLMGGLNCDGSGVLAVGAVGDDDGGPDRGAVWLLSLDADGTVRTYEKISDEHGGFTGTLNDDDIFGVGVASLGDLDSDGVEDLAVGASHDDDGGTDRGAVWMIFLSECLVEQPSISSITDVGNDQGRSVRINFSPSGLDHLSSPTPVLQYEAFRRIDPLPGSGEMGVVARGKKTDMVSDHSILLEGWEFVAAIPAHAEPEYNMIAPTLADSTITHGMHWSVFFVRAATSEPGIFFDSLPDSGYSIDNLEPAAPQNLVFTEPGLLAWDEAPEPDFNYFSVYGSPSKVFDDQAELIGQTTNTTMDVQTEVYPFYYVTATDFSGNEGDAATTFTVVGVTDTPEKYKLGIGAYPNPFNPVTTIRYSIPEAGSVALRIYDAEGRLVRTLFTENKSAGVYTTVWHGRDQNDTNVSTGVYFARLEAAGQVRSIKIVLLK